MGLLSEVALVALKLLVVYEKPWLRDVQRLLQHFCYIS